MTGDGSDAHQDKARRFRDAALPHLDDAYTLARYLLRDAADAEDAVQECYLRALRYFDTFRGTEIKPWLFAILRNICRGEFARRSRVTLAIDDTTDDAEDAAPLWQEEQASPETEMLHRWDAETIRRLVAELPDPFREAIVLRKINDLSYSEIADVVGVPKAQMRVNHAKSRIRARIEHVFGAQQNGPGGRIVRTIGIARARAKIGLQNLAYNIRRLVTLERLAAA